MDEKKVDVVKPQFHIGGTGCLGFLIGLAILFNFTRVLDLIEMAIKH